MDIKPAPLSKAIGAHHRNACSLCNRSFLTRWVAPAETYVRVITNRPVPGSRNQVAEFAGSDGYLSQCFVNLENPAPGTEPAGNVAETAIKRNVPSRIATRHSLRLNSQKPERFKREIPIHQLQHLASRNRTEFLYLDRNANCSLSCNAR